MNERGEIKRLPLSAEREGFEPSVQLPVQRFSRPSHSTALASLLALRLERLQMYAFESYLQYRDLLRA